MSEDTGEATLFVDIENDQATVHEKIHFSIKTGTFGHHVLDISSLGADLDIYTLDPGFKSTASCLSEITYIDGDEGRLLYRGYPIEELANNCSYPEVCHLLLFGELPTLEELNAFSEELNEHSLVHEQLSTFFNGFRRDSHPMAIMVGVVGALSAFYHDSHDINNPEDRRLSAIRLIAKMPTIAAMSYKYSLGQPFVYPQNEMGYAENLYNMMFGMPNQETEIDPVFIRALDAILTLHADHGQNASTTTVRVAASTGANPFVCISAGIGCLWGPAHGGANEACLHMLQEIGEESRVQEYIDRAKDPNDAYRLMGFGHRVYKNKDPRGEIMKNTCYEVLEATGRKDDPIFKVAQLLEQAALEDEYFQSRRLYPNVDFYSGITLSALGIPTNMFTVIFSVARTVGWLAHWLEMMSSPGGRVLSRPRQLYVGPPERTVHWP